MQNIYFITDREYVKIGIANDVHKRLKQLQTGNPKQLELLFFIKGELETELFLHNYYKEYKVKNEWFDLLPLNITKEEVLKITPQLFNKKQKPFKNSIVINVDSLHLLYEFKGMSKDILFHIVSKMNSKNEVIINLQLKEEIVNSLEIGLDYVNKTISTLFKSNILLKETDYRSIYIVNKNIFTLINN